MTCKDCKTKFKTTDYSSFWGKKTSLCPNCRHSNMGGFVIQDFMQKHISRSIKRSDIKQNQFVIRDKHGDPLAVGDAPKPLPQRLQNL